MQGRILDVTVGLARCSTDSGIQMSPQQTDLEAQTSASPIEGVQNGGRRSQKWSHAQAQEQKLDNQLAKAARRHGSDGGTV